MKKLNYKLSFFAVLLALGACNQAPKDEASNNPELSISSQTNELPPPPKADAAKAKPMDNVGAGNAPSQKIIQESLAGVWVLKGEACDGGNGIIFDANGQYAAEGEVGTWRANGNNIKITANPSEEAAGTSAKEIYDLKVLSLEANSAIMQRSDNSNVEWQRCSQVPNLNPTDSQTTK